MKRILLDERKPYYKGNMHCHSTLSDGRWSPAELKERYKAQGYQFLAITDHEHFNCHAELDDADFITITGAEYAIKEFPEQSTLKNYRMKVCHLNLYAKKQENVFNICYNSVLDHYTTGERRAALPKPEKDYDRVYGKEGINALIREANESGFFVCYNHPRWSLENYGDYGGYEGLWGVEILNYSSTQAGLYDYDIAVLDDFLRDGKRVFASCGDDNHNLWDDSFGAFVMVNAPALTYDDLIGALLAGDFYASAGPRIEALWVENGRVYIRCSEASAITLSTEGRRCDAIRDEKGLLREADFAFFPEDGYFRLDVIDARGRRANTQAYPTRDFAEA